MVNELLNVRIILNQYGAQAECLAYVMLDNRKQKCTRDMIYIIKLTPYNN